jgi:hypothetical protein
MLDLRPATSVLTTLVTGRRLILPTARADAVPCP